MFDTITAHTLVRDERLPVVRNLHLTPSLNILGLHAPYLASVLKAGQFLEIKTSDSLVPLLRRPFSVHRIEGDIVEIMVKVVGIGTQQLYDAREGETLQTLAPLGNAFGYDKDDFDLALLVSGGIGVAPMALLQAALEARQKEVYNFVGARTAEDIVTRYLSNVQVATDDGSLGYKGTVVALFEQVLPTFQGKRLRVFGCGPNRMLSALCKLCNSHGIPCEVSIESTMGCGIGICYGCPIRVRDSSGKVHQKLLCRYGSVVDAKEIVFDEE
ncbi:MAG: dihydroorotate dehydrogenase electron transfer subunit [Chloroherpetonaceae bacterium]|nr:dihydroorotate dehydrogenase electron transfer subunit [Chloroherpetonaceae bacterium]MCS7212553.1 dihydroorotate dehydrogenase electron transfer subunit [Chloroherpetonaceae bacterium]MDW8018706.1 dihydroorotate dehydrogenase electron transfer subunit [Chloroherpetonaceae bacterium]MDW8466316.1 dihydroorotate dehydrogenase electron transfer subunit [Chloroherpetonaceae bacterium]